MRLLLAPQAAVYKVGGCAAVLGAYGCRGCHFTLSVPGWLPACIFQQLLQLLRRIERLGAFVHTAAPLRHCQAATPLQPAHTRVTVAVSVSSFDDHFTWHVWQA